MNANAIALITNYLADQKNMAAIFTRESVTNELVTPGAQFISGAHSVKLPVISFSDKTFSAYSKIDGYTQKEGTLSWEVYTMTQDCGNKIYVDAIDEEDSGTSIIAFFNSYLRIVVIPAVDKYRLGALARGANALSTKCEAASASNSFAILKAFRKKFVNANAPEKGNIIYMNTDFRDYVENSSSFTRFIQTQAWNGDINDQVEQYNHNKIIVVGEDRWPYDELDLLVVNPSAQFSAIKHEENQFWPRIPGHRGSQIDYNMFHDCWVFAQRNKAIYGHWEKPVKPTAPDAATFASTMKVKIECATPGAKIYYTDDGSTTPTASSTEYTSEITLSATKTIKAIAIKDSVSSDVISTTYTKS